MRALILGLAAVASLAAPANAAPTVRKGPIPGWVEQMRSPRDAVPPASAVAVYYTILDRQVRHRHGELEQFSRYADMALSTDGVQQVSRVSVQFEPSYQTLTIHHLRVIRGDQVRDVLDPEAFRVVSVESDSRARMYRGLVEASYEIPDVRVGDIVELAYTIRGANPVYGDAILDDWPIEFNQPVGELRYRLLAPAGTRLAVDRVRTDRELTRRQRGELQELRYRARDVPARDFDSERPGWFDAQPRFRISSFASWGAVAAWAMPLYRDASEVDDGIRQLADRIRRQHPTALARAGAAARFVQDEIRYVSILVGPHTHAPHPAPQVLRQRYGDCKDKSTLLATLLRELEIPAQPALVSSYRGRGLDDWPATPWAFDHVIVWALIDGREAWIDPTMTEVRGDDLEPPDYDRALVVSATTAELAEIEQPALAAPLIEVREAYDAPTKGPGSANLEVTTIYRGAEANAYRRRLGSQSRDDIARDYLNYYTRRYPEIEAAGELEVEDDAEANELTVRERYSISNFYGDDNKESIGATEVTGWLSKPSDLQRTSPWALAHPTWIRQVIRVRVAPGFVNQIGHETVDNDFFHYTMTSEVQDGEVVIDTELRTRTDAVPADRIADYVAAVDEVNENAEWELEVGAGGWEFASGSTDAGAGLIVIGVIMAGVLGFIVLYNRRKPTLFADSAPAAAQAHQAPATPPNGLALTAMIIGFVGLGLVIVPVVNLILGVLAVTFGAIGARRANQRDGKGYGAALAGITLGIFDLIFGTLILGNLLSRM
jgi:transglutaminase-like putative cysteine protease